MSFEDYFYLGHISKTFGYKGELIAYLDVDDIEAYEDMESVFLNLNGKLVPFFFQKFELKKNAPEAIIAFQDINTMDKAKALIGTELYLPANLLPQLDGDAFYFHELQGYLAIDENEGTLGEVTGVLDYPGNPVIQIQVKDKELLIPAQDQFIERIDKNKKSLFIKNAKGLIDLYLREIEE